MVKGKFDYYNGETRMKYYAVRVFPHSIQNENKALLSRLELYKDKKEASNITVGGDGFMIWTLSLKIKENVWALKN